MSSRSTVLLVEDDPVLRQTLTLVLRRFAVPCVAVGSKEAALAALDALAGPIVLLTDRHLGEECGLELAAHAVSEKHDLDVILMSGFGLDLPPHTIPPERIRGVLGKPFDLADLWRLVS